MSPASASASPGRSQRPDGTLIQAVNLPLRNIGLRALISAELDAPVVIENDGNCAALGEHRFGAAAGTTHSVTLTLGTGVGGGIVADGRLLAGRTRHRRRARAHRDRARRPSLPGIVPRARPPRGLLLRHRPRCSRTRGRLRRRARRAGAGDQGRARRARADRRSVGGARCGPRLARERARARGVRDRRRPRRCRRRADPAASRARSSATQALPPNGEARLVSASLGNDAGMIGAACLVLP